MTGTDLMKLSQIWGRDPAQNGRSTDGGALADLWLERA
jgi:hypothetical protein